MQKVKTWKKRMILSRVWKDSFPSDCTRDDDECFYARDDHEEVIWYMASSSNMDGGSRDSPPQQNKKKVRGICKMKQVTGAGKEGTKLRIGWNSRANRLTPTNPNLHVLVGMQLEARFPFISPIRVKCL
ncbi:hypothetical protein SESBI_21433 [Sesbania bispinosa]|nr:hypothetical protein SESBI_21433 [Sesbania bispinosa]